MRDKKRNTKDTLRVNRMIRVPRVRVIGPEGDQIGVLDTRDALAMAQEKYSLDLIEISPMAKPPVCKIMDYGKYKYQLKKKSQEARKNQTTITVKEVKLRPNTDEHDLNVKIRNMARFLEEGNKIKVTIRFRGREVVHSQIGQDVLRRIADELGEAATVEAFPKLEGRNMIMVLAPNLK